MSRYNVVPRTRFLSIRLTEAEFTKLEAMADRVKPYDWQKAKTSEWARKALLDLEASHVAEIPGTSHAAISPSHAAGRRLRPQTSHVASSTGIPSKAKKPSRGKR